ncbi:MAG: polysaccharide deacetylase family protein [Solirubrobacterales bacterium]
MTYLVDRGYRGVTFSEAVAQETRGRVVAITFDDAFASVFDRALPILRRHLLPATLFVPTRFVDSPEAMVWDGTSQWLDKGYRDELQCMTSEQIRGLADAGWEIGAHSYDHPRLTELSQDGIEQQMQRSKETCERIAGGPCRSIAYPYGDADAKVEAAAARAGFSAAAGLSSDLSRSGPFYRARTGIYHDDGTLRFRLKCSRLVRGLRGRGIGTRLRRFGAPGRQLQS